VTDEQGLVPPEASAEEPVEGKESEDEDERQESVFSSKKDKKKSAERIKQEETEKEVVNEMKVESWTFSPLEAFFALLLLLLLLFSLLLLSAYYFFQVRVKMRRPTKLDSKWHAWKYSDEYQEQYQDGASTKIKKKGGEGLEYINNKGGGGEGGADIGWGRRIYDKNEIEVSDRELDLQQRHYGGGGGGKTSIMTY